MLQVETAGDGIVSGLRSQNLLFVVRLFQLFFKVLDPLLLLLDERVLFRVSAEKLLHVLTCL